MWIPCASSTWTSGGTPTSTIFPLPVMLSLTMRNLFGQPCLMLTIYLKKCQHFKKYFFLLLNSWVQTIQMLLIWDWFSLYLDLNWLPLSIHHGKRKNGSKDYAITWTGLSLVICLKKAILKQFSSERPFDGVTLQEIYYRKDYDFLKDCLGDSYHFSDFDEDCGALNPVSTKIIFTQIFAVAYWHDHFRW